MKQLSHWANKHKWKARIIMIISWIILTVLAIVIGKNLSSLEVLLPSTILLVIVATFFASCFYYPSRSEKTTLGFSGFYAKQKTCDLLLAVCSFCLVLYTANKPETLFQHYENLYAASIEPSIAKDSSAKTYKSLKDFSASLKNADGKLLKWKERKKLLKQQVKAIKHSRDTPKGDKVLLSVLSVLLALGLLYLVAALSCSLSCNGSEAAAVIVGIGGAGLIIFLLILALRGISGKRKKRKQQIESLPEN